MRRTIPGTDWAVEDAQEYLRTRVEVSDRGCWIWKRFLLPTGYGQMRLAAARRNMRAHRLAYEAFVGPIPEGMQVCHSCDVRACCNPNHLFLGSNADNVRDRDAKGRQARGSHHGMAKLTESQVAQIKKHDGVQREVAVAFGISQPQVSMIRSGKRWGYLEDL